MFNVATKELFYYSFTMPTQQQSKQCVVMIIRQRLNWPTWFLVLALLASFLVGRVSGSLGDRLPDFKNCVSVWIAVDMLLGRTKVIDYHEVCVEENCEKGATTLRMKVNCGQP